jgi:hypothetical protein
LLEQQQAEAKEEQNMSKAIDLWQIEIQLTGLLGCFLSLFRVPESGRGEDDNHATHPFVTLGGRILRERAAVLTFNYDTLLENAIALASGSRETSAYHTPKHQLEYRIEPDQKPNVTYDLLSHSTHIWNPILAYGFEFDEVQVVNDSTVPSVSGDRFYSHPDNKRYDVPFIKLHGSLTWFSYTGAGLKSEGQAYTDSDKKEKTIWFPDPYRWAAAQYGNTFLRHEDWILEPLLITPVLNKGVTKFPFRRLWRIARQQLRSCRRLVVGGYSFSPTDFATRRMFLEAFADHTPEELVVINPDTRVVQLVKDLCYFGKPVLVCKNLEEFLSM